MKYQCRIIFYTCIISTFLIASIAFAQSSDLTAPTILLEPPVPNLSLDAKPEEEVFWVEVTDDNQVARVGLFYRFENQDTYRSKTMELMPESVGIYKTEVIVTDPDATAIEYYIDAEDKAGNFRLKGQSFNPIIRKIDQRDITTLVPPKPKSQPKEIPKENPIEPSKKYYWYYALGAVVLGGLIASQGGGNGGDVIPPPQCDDTGCPVVFTFNPVRN